MIRGILEAFSSDLAAQNAIQEKTGDSPDLAECARRAVQEFSTSFLDHGVRLRVDPRVDKSGDWHVAGDAARLDRIFGNLLENAMRYSPKGTTVTVGIDDQRGFVLAFVDDEGPGLPKDQPENQLFALFSKGKSHSGKAGLGLYFCKITVERWGGTIGAETRPQGGSRFWFRLPRAEKVASSAKQAAPKKSSTETHPEKHKLKTRLRILVADDADINRDLIVELLEDLSECRVVYCPLERPSEIAGHLVGTRQDNSSRRQTLHQAIAFVGAEDKCPVFFDWSSEGRSELILLIVQKKWIEVAAIIQHVIAEKFVKIAVNSIGAGFGDDVYDGAGITTVFGIESVGQNTKLFDGIRRRLNGRSVHEDVVSVSTVHHVVVGATAAPVDGNGAGIIAAEEEIVA